MRYKKQKKTSTMWIKVTAMIVAILVLFPYAMAYAEGLHPDPIDDPAASAVEEELDPDTEPENPSAESSGEGENGESSDPEGSESSQATEENPEADEESALEEPEDEEDEPDEEDSNGAIAYIKPLSTSGISLFATSLPVGSFSALQTAVQNADTDIEVLFTANVAFSGTIEIKAGKTVVMKSNDTNARVLSVNATMGKKRHFVVNGNLILESNVILDGKNAAGDPFGGGILVRSGATLAIRGAIIRNCKSDLGGGVSITGGSSATMSAGAIQNAMATRGAGVYIENGSFQMSGTAIIEDCTATGTETPQGAGVYVSLGTFEMIGSSQIRNCIAVQLSPVGDGSKNIGNGQGGGIFIAKSGTAIIGVSEGTASPVISGNIAHTKISFSTGKTDDWGGLGGGLYSDSGIVTIYPGAIFRDCHASNNGGAVFVTNANFTVKGGTVTDCTAANGGGLFIKDKPIIITAIDISNCNAIYQGGALVASATQVTLGSGVTISQCSAGTPYFKTWWSGKGGGIYVSNSAKAKLIMQSGSSIRNCSAFTMDDKNPNYGNLFGSGGGIYIDTAGQADLTGVSITDCSADHHGGGIFVKKYENLSTQNVSFQGNYACFYRVPSDNVVNGLYPSCSDALSISLDPADIENRSYPLNNYDINHFSYTAIYHGNGGIDPALPAPHNVYRIVEEFTGFQTSDTASNALHTVYSNKRSENGNRFEFRKDGSEYGATSNYDIYRPDQQYFFTYGPTQAYDPYPYSPARPTLATQTLSVSNLMSVSLPEIKYFMLYTKNLTIEKKLDARFGNQEMKFDIDLQVFDYFSNPLALLDKTYAFKHGDSDTFRIYDSLVISVEEDPSSANGYEISYFDGATTTTSFAKQSLGSYSQKDITLTVTNTRFDPVPTDVTGLADHAFVLLAGSLGLLGFLSLVIYQRRRRC